MPAREVMAEFVGPEDRENRHAVPESGQIERQRPGIENSGSGVEAESAVPHRARDRGRDDREDEEHKVTRERFAPGLVERQRGYVEAIRTRRFEPLVERG